jgi:hypothetical protein
MYHAAAHAAASHAAATHAAAYHCAAYHAASAQHDALEEGDAQYGALEEDDAQYGAGDAQYGGLEEGDAQYGADFDEEEDAQYGAPRHATHLPVEASNGRAPGRAPNTALTSPNTARAPTAKEIWRQAEEALRLESHRPEVARYGAYA